MLPFIASDRKSSSNEQQSAMPKVTTKKVELRFYGMLNDFLHPASRQVPFWHGYMGSPSVKDIIESVGVPHVEVALILVNGVIVPFDFHPENGDRISCYSRFHSINIGSINLLQDLPSDPRFILDVHLGKLAKYMRIMGFDTLYQTNFTDSEILRIASDECRIILTRDLGILRNGLAKWGYYIRSTMPRLQLIEVMDAFSLREKSNPFSRCSICNGLVEIVSKEQIIKDLNTSTIRYYKDFFRCQSCGQIYWEGSHYKKIEKFIDENLNGERKTNHEE